MIVRRYKGKSLESLRATVLKEMGSKAVIVHTEKTGGDGILGSLKGTEYEVIAAVEDAFQEGQINQGSEVDNEQLNELMASQKMQYQGLRKSMKRIDDTLGDLDAKIKEISKQQTALPPQNPFQSAFKELENVHPEWHNDIYLNASKNSQGTIKAENWLEALADKIPSAGGILFRKTTGSAPDVYAFCGPTGVGKTTTLAKLAAQAVLKDGLNVGLITIDTFRVGAVDQLREYANLLGAELAVVFTATEMEHQLKAFHDKDLVLIDTQGRGPFDNEGIEQIKTILEAIPSVNTLLHFPASIRRKDAIQNFKSFRRLNPVCTVITKADEANTCDGLTQLFETSSIPVVYVTDGQRVPEDIHPASAGLLARIIFPILPEKEKK